MTDLKTLIEDYFAGELTDEQSRDLSQRLVDSADARRLVWEHAQQEALLEQLVEESRGETRSVRLKPESPAKAGSIVEPAQSNFARASGFKGSRRLRWLSTAVVVLLMATMASAAVFPPVRGLVARWWLAVVGGVPVNAPREVVKEDVDQVVTDQPKPIVIAEQAAEPKKAEPAKPTPKPALKDEQKIAHWEWDKFRWQAVDANLVRPVSTSITIPTGHKFVTVVVDDANGVRVRNLLDAVEITKLGGKANAREPQVLGIEWNGLDDYGRSVPDGAYRIRGCSHPGLKCVYEYSFLNPGSPPWEHYKNSGWGGDHGYPHAIACLRGHNNGAWRVALGGHTAEGGSPGFVLGADDKKTHAFGRGWSGPKAMAASDGLLWIALGGGKDIQRIKYHTGGNAPFQTAKGPQALLKFDEDVWAIAVGTDKAAVLVHKEGDANWKDRVVIFDKNTGENRVVLPMDHAGQRNGLAFDATGRGLLISSVAGLFRVPAQDANPQWERITPVEVEKPGALATDKDGNLFVMDRGADYQTKVFAPDGKLLRAIGTNGGQGQRLEFDPAALHCVEAISVDDDGHLWVAENGDQDRPAGVGLIRRIAVWDRDGHFIKDFVGTTWYGANATCLHEQDPTLGYGYGVIYKLELGKKPGYRPWSYVSTAQPADSPFWLWTGAPWTLFGSARMFRSNVSGSMREYLLQSNGFPILFQADERGEYLPILAIGSHEHNKAFPLVKDEPKAVFLWTDLNADARAQPDEFQHLPGSTYRADVGTGYPPSRELIWYVEGIELKPQRFTAQGVPVYDVASAKRLPIPQHYLPVGKHLVTGLQGKFNSPQSGVYQAGHHLFTDLNGKSTATYRSNWPAVHASWSSTLHQLGQTGCSVGELHYAGIIDSRSDVGHVVAMQGNKGQSFLWSEDGLFVSPLFKDSRESPQGWGGKEEFGADWTNISLYDECFGGMMARQDDGVVRYLFGRNGCQVVRVEGLELVKRFDAGVATLAKSVGRVVEKPGQVTVGPRSGEGGDEAGPLRVPNVRGRYPAFKVDGDSVEWQKIARHEIKVADKVVAKVAIAHSLEHLWLLAEVEDPSPWKNAGADPKFAFKTGDAIDLTLGSDRPDRMSSIAGDIRVLIAPSEKGPIAMAYRPVKPDAKPEEALKFESTAKSHTFASVMPVGDAQVAFKETKTGYTVEVRLSCDHIELKHLGPGLRMRGDIGILWGNEAGLVTERRTYLFNRSPSASIVSDTPSEAELHPAEWGAWVIE